MAAETHPSIALEKDDVESPEDLNLTGDGKPSSFMQYLRRGFVGVFPLMRSLFILALLALVLAVVLMSIERPPEKDRQEATFLRLKNIEETVLLRFSLMHAMPDMSDKYPSCRYSCEACFPKPKKDDEDGVRIARTLYYKTPTEQCTSQEVDAWKAAVSENETLWNTEAPPKGTLLMMRAGWCTPLCVYEFPSVEQVEACRMDSDAVPMLNPLEFNETCLDKSTADCPNCRLLTTRLPELAYATSYNYTSNVWKKEASYAMQTAEVYTLMKAELEEGVEETRWDFRGSLFFAVTILTTIGYGNYAPSQEDSRLMIVLFTLPLVAAFGFALAELSELYTELATNLLASFARATAGYRKTHREKSPHDGGEEEGVAPDMYLVENGADTLKSELRRERRIMASFESSAARNKVKLSEGLTFDEFSSTLRDMREVSELHYVLGVNDRGWLKSLFDEFDTDRSGHLDARELAVLLAKVVQRIDARKNEVLAQFRIVATVVLAILILVVGSLVFWGLADGWTFLDAVYFTFITLTTIGLGDYVPDHGAMMVAWYVITISGLGIFGALVSNVSAIFTAQAELAKLGTGVVSSEGGE